MTSTWLGRDPCTQVAQALGVAAGGSACDLQAAARDVALVLEAVDEVAITALDVGLPEWVQMAYACTRTACRGQRTLDERCNQACGEEGPAWHVGTWVIPCAAACAQGWSGAGAIVRGHLAHSKMPPRRLKTLAVLAASCDAGQVDGYCAVPDGATGRWINHRFVGCECAFAVQSGNAKRAVTPRGTAAGRADYGAGHQVVR